MDGWFSGDGDQLTRDRSRQEEVLVGFEGRMRQELHKEWAMQ